MSHAATSMKRVVRDLLGTAPSESLYARIDKLIDDADTGAAALRQATGRVRGLVKLFVDRTKAEALERKLRDVLEA